MIKASINLQDLRRKIYIKAKTESTWRFARQRKGFGWDRWSKNFIYQKVRYI
jgi:hypothetical protein